MVKSQLKVIHFGTNRFPKYDFLYAVNSNFCSRTHRLPRNVTFDTRQTADRRAQHCSTSAAVNTVQTVMVSLMKHKHNQKAVSNTLYGVQNAGKMQQPLGLLILCVKVVSHSQCS